MHRHATPQECQVCGGWPDWARHLAARLNALSDHIQLGLDDIGTKLDNIDKQLNRITQKENSLMTSAESNTEAIAALQAQVDANGSVEESAIALIEGIASQLTAAAGDPAAVQALADTLQAQSTALAASVLANTPAAPPAPAV